MEVFDNVNNIVKDDLEKVVTRGSKISIAAACFSIYAFQELKKQLENIDELRFIFTSPTFIAEKNKKQKREFFIPQLGREKSLYGTEYEIKLRNELTQKAIAKECADWIRKKVKFKSNITNDHLDSFINIENSEDTYCYSNIKGFTTTDIGCEKGNNITNFVIKMESPQSKSFLNTFNAIWSDKDKLQDVTQQIIDNISNVYKENSGEFIYFISLYNIFNEFLEDISEDYLPNEATGFKESVIWNTLYDFQKDASLAIINKLEKYNGCILADSVGLGKTFTAISVIKYYENRNKSVLVLCPKKLYENWQTYKGNYKNNPLEKDRLRYDVLYHTDLSREYGKSNGIDLARLNWGNYDLVVIDESHNFRNGGKTKNDKENRYLRLMNKVIKSGVKTKVLMLSATPVNNRFADLKNQLELAYEGEAANIDDKLDTQNSIDAIFKKAQMAFNTWSKLEPEKRTTEALLEYLDFDFFELLDSVTIARSRKHIEKYYDINSIGQFPTRLPVITQRPSLTKDQNICNYNQIYDLICKLNLKIYMPSDYIFPSRVDYYFDEDAKIGKKDSREGALGREEGIRRLMSINLLKRLESSVYAFKLTLERVRDLIKTTLDNIEEYEKSGGNLANTISSTKINANDFDEDDQNFDFFSKIKNIFTKNEEEKNTTGNNEDFDFAVDDYDIEDDEDGSTQTIGKKKQIKLKDMDYKTWRTHLKDDFEILKELISDVEKVTPDIDEKLQTLFDVIKNKIENPINDNNKKIIIFSAFADTVEYLYKHVSKYVKNNFGLESALVTGQKNQTTIPKVVNDLNTVLTFFSPISKHKEMIYPDKDFKIDVLIATDCISEGQNLQDCDYLVNYDIHWNPVRIIQRFGRIDRIGSKNDVIQLVNFWPDITLDEYINLKSRVETRMKATIITSTAATSDNVLDDEEAKELEYRKKQLKKLQSEVVDIEEMNTGINIMDLGLNEFRLDLLNYMKEHKDVEHTPYGMHAVVESTPDMPAGVVFILKNISNDINIDNQNRLHPFYMVYIGEDGIPICTHLQAKKMLDMMRLVCKQNSTPNEKLCKEFNEETSEGKNMGKYSELLEEAISSIINVKDEKDDDSAFSEEESTFNKNTINGLDDFELICFLVVKDGN